MGWFDKVKDAASDLFESGAGAFLPSMAGSALEIYNTNQANANARRMQRTSLQFQDVLSRTGYQRAADDLEKAGLNRVLALGSPARASGGATAQTFKSDSGNAAIAAASAKAAIQQMEAKTQLDNEQAKLVREQTRLADANASEAEVKKMIYDKIEPQLNVFMDWALNNLGVNASDVTEAKLNAAKEAVFEKVDSFRNKEERDPNRPKTQYAPNQRRR